MPNVLAGQAVVAAVLETLRADVVLAALVSDAPGGGPAIYEELAPESAPWDYLVVTAPSETPANTLGRGFGAAVLVYLRAVSRKARTAQAIASRAVALLDAPDTALAVSAYGSPAARAASELVSAGPGYPEEIRGEAIHHYPAVVRVTVHQ